MAEKYKEDADDLKHQLNAKVEENFKLQQEVNRLRLTVHQLTSANQTKQLRPMM